MHFMIGNSLSRFSFILFSSLADIILDRIWSVLHQSPEQLKVSNAVFMFLRSFLVSRKLTCSTCPQFKRAFKEFI